MSFWDDRLLCPFGTTNHRISQYCWSANIPADREVETIQKRVSIHYHLWTDTLQGNVLFNTKWINTTRLVLVSISVSLLVQGFFMSQRKDVCLFAFPTISTMCAFHLRLSLRMTPRIVLLHPLYFCTIYV